MIDRTKSLAERMALSVMQRYTADQVQWHYEHGLVLQSIFILGEQTGEAAYCQWVKALYDLKITHTIEGYREDEYNLDQINPGKTLFRLYKTYGEGRYRAAIERLRAQLRSQPRTQTQGFWHKKIYPFQMWLDGLYMQGPFYAQYTAEFGDEADFADVVHQFVLMESQARDPKTGLLYHAWDESRKQLWADPETGCSPHFWGRALGWYCMALVDTLDYIPETRAKDRDTLRAIANRLVPPLLAYQDPQNGLWYQVVDHGGRDKNYHESSASAMFVYFLLKLIRTGMIGAVHRDAAREAAFKAYGGLIERMITEDAAGELHLEGICKVAGLGGIPYRDGSYAYYVREPVGADDFKGVGPFILASLEQARSTASGH
ncbi:MAG: glycoside hydrolase family 88 protein [Spirochaetaceae bacterium]|jgi:unsaturated rhamnogalacturonyl hydrolase|nr:glycoside hydrolase family 88 protein [Spirochaetaceae bacterium]